MAKSTIRIRAKAAGDGATIKALVKHPMETGTRKKKNGDLIPAHHITELTATVNGKPVMTANWGPAISKNPYLSFKVAGAKSGDVVKLTWVDNKGGTDSLEAPIK
jgi:sulfur-oxidizing protein SoxZ